MRKESPVVEPWVRKIQRADLYKQFPDLKKKKYHIFENICGRSKSKTMKSNKKILKNYCFGLDNFERGVNKRMQILVSDYNLKNAKNQVAKMLGKIVADKMTLEFSEKD